MLVTIVGQKRKDGKYKVQTAFKGEANMFGGFYPTKFYNTLKTPSEVHALLDQCAPEETYNTEDFLAREVLK